MMKKRLLMPLLVAGVMVASVAILDSCKKTNSNSGEFTTVIRDKDGSPLIDMIYLRDPGVPYTVCPYCADTVLENDTLHFHTFGVKIVETGSGIDTLYGQYPVDHCNIAYATEAQMCKYSGYWYTHGQPYDKYKARYHAHRVCLVDGLPGHWAGHNGYHNEWHVGGGVEDGWPAPYDPNATPNP